MKMNRIYSIPSELFPIIQEYLENFEYYQLLITSKLFQNVKKESIYLNLNGSDSQLYLNDAKFQSKLHQLIKDPSKQISLRFDYDLEYVIGEEDTLSVHSVIIIGDVQLHSLNPLKNLTKLEIFSCYFISDVSMLGGIYDLTLSYCFGVVDVSALGMVHSLNLTGCNAITDVSALGNVYRLILASCNSIQDISQLGRNHYLDFTSKLE